MDTRGKQIHAEAIYLRQRASIYQQQRIGSRPFNPGKLSQLMHRADEAENRWKSYQLAIARQNGLI